MMREKKALKPGDLRFFVSESAPFTDFQEHRPWPDFRPFQLRKRRTGATTA
jgi:hypothetical protein